MTMPRAEPARTPAGGTAGVAADATALLVRKLNQFELLSPSAVDMLGACVARTVAFKAGDEMISAGDPPRFLHLLVDGWGARYKVLPDGSRQIMAFLISGDLCDVQVALLNRMDHSIGALTPCTVALLSLERVAAIVTGQPQLTRSLWWSTLVDEAVLREWLVTMGRRPAARRVAHLMCEMHRRLGVVGLSGRDEFELPLTQRQFADAMGLSIIHMSRTLGTLRRMGLAALNGKVLSILDREGLYAFAEFDPGYLHQEAYQGPSRREM